MYRGPLCLACRALAAVCSLPPPLFSALPPSPASAASLIPQELSCWLGLPAMLLDLLHNPAFSVEVQMWMDLSKMTTVQTGGFLQLLHVSYYRRLFLAFLSKRLSLWLRKLGE